MVMVTLSQTSPCFYLSAVQVLRNHCGKGEIARSFSFTKRQNLRPVQMESIKNFVDDQSNLVHVSFLTLSQTSPGFYVSAVQVF